MSSVEREEPHMSTDVNHHIPGMNFETRHRVISANPDLLERQLDIGIDVGDDEPVPQGDFGVSAGLHEP